MSSPYPYVSQNTCLNCKGRVIVKQKRDINSQYCSRECYNQYRRRGKPIKISYTDKYICLKCKRAFIPTRNTLGMYCSYACSNGAKSVRHKLVCECCGKNFEINNIAEIKRGHYKYCSNECRKRKYHINEKLFDEINENSAYWLGFIWATIWDNKYNKIFLLSKKNLLERFNQSFNSTYPIKKSVENKYMIRITSLLLLSKLADFGLKTNPFLEFPDIPKNYYKDFIRGYFDSDLGYHYKDHNEDIAVIYGRSSKLMLAISDFLKSKLVITNGEWASVSFDFYSLIKGNPFLEEKWIKFNQI